MLGRNKYRVRFSQDITFDDLKSLLLLYQPLISANAVILYEHLQMEGDRENTISSLIDRCALSLNDLEAAFKRLNEYKLVDTFVKNEDYLFVLHKPLTGLSFLNNDLYNKLLRRELGSEEFVLRVSAFSKQPIDVTDGYKNISSQLTAIHTDDHLASSGSDSNGQEVLRTSYFDISRFVKNASTVLLPQKARTIHNLNVISSLADTYGITQDEMRRFVSQCIKDNDLDTTALKIKCQHAKSDYNSKGDGYDVPCAVFLRKLQSDRELTPNDIKMLDKLINEYHLNPSVVNVLLEHAMKMCDNHLYTSYIYPIAGDLNRNGVDTSEKALTILKKSSVSKPKTNYKEILPVYEKTDLPVSDKDIDLLIEQWRNNDE